MNVGENLALEWNALEAKLKNCLSVYAEPIPSLQEVNTIPGARLWGGNIVTHA